MDCGNPLHHADFHAAFLRALERHFVHEAAHEEDAATVGLEQVFLRASGSASVDGSKPQPSSRTQDREARAAAVLERR